MLIDAKQLSSLGLKDMQLIHVTLFSRSASSLTSATRQQNLSAAKITKECIPMLILSNEANFSSLFDLLILISTYNSQHLSSELGLKANKSLDSVVEKSEQLSANLWQLIVLLPTNWDCYKLISARLEWHLGNLADELILQSPHQLRSPPYKILYYLQIIEIVHKKANDLKTTQEKHQSAENRDR